MSPGGPSCCTRPPSITARSRRSPRRTTGGTGTRRTCSRARPGAPRTRPPRRPTATWPRSSTSSSHPPDARRPAPGPAGRVAAVGHAPGPLGHKRIDDLVERLWLLGEAEVRGVLDDRQPRAGDPAVHLLQVAGRAFVVAAADEQRADADLRQPVHDVPGLQDAGDGELARAVHRVVDVVACFGEGALQAGRPRVEAAYVLAVEAQDGGLVLGTAGEAGRLVLADDASGFLGLLGQEFGAVADPADHAGRAAAQDQAVQLGLVPLAVEDEIGRASCRERGESGEAG